MTFPFATLDEVEREMKLHPKKQGRFFWVQGQEEKHFIAKLYGLQTQDVLREQEQEIVLVYETEKSLKKAWKRIQRLFIAVGAAGGLVYNPDKEVLLIKSRGIWSFPKGHIDKGETPDETALREVAEETGVSKLTLGETLPATWHTFFHNRKGWVFKKTYWYEMHAPMRQRLTPQVEENIEEVIWLSPSVFLKKYRPIYPLTKKLLRSSMIEDIT